MNYLSNSKGTCIWPTILFTSHTMFSLSCVVWGMDCYGCKVTCPNGCSTGTCKYDKNKNKKWYYSLGWTTWLMFGQRLLCVILNLCLIFILIQECWQLTLEFTGELLFDGFFKKGWKLDITRGSLCIYIFKRHTSTGNIGLFPFNMPWLYQMCIAKCHYSSSSHRDDLPGNLGIKTTQKCQKSTSSWCSSLKNIFA